MKKETIALHLRSKNYTDLYIFAQAIHDGVQSKSALFPVPVPSLPVFQASINTMSGSIEKWGIKGNQGGTAERKALLEAREVLRGQIKSYARYVITTQPDNSQSWVDVGFELKKQPAKTGTMEAVRNLHQFIARNIPQGQIKIKWSRPLGVSIATVITYKIFRSADELFANAIFIGATVNKATYIDIPPKAAEFFFYWVIPVTTAGDGAMSLACRAFANPV